MAKTKRSSAHMQFAQCAIGSRDRAWFIAEEEDVSRVLQLRGGKWSVKTPEWSVSSVCGREFDSKSFEVIALGIDGELLVGVPGGFSESHVDPQGAGPERFGVLRDIRMIGDEVFAAGMSRQVYRRRGTAWNDISLAIHAKPGDALGFNSIDGFSADAVFAVGYHGEVWFYDGTSWRQLDSPTSVALHRVVTLPPEHALMCGASGVLLQASPNGIAPVQNDATRDNLYGLTVFKGRVFVSSMTALYALGPDGLALVDTGLAGPLTFGFLDANDDVMWSVGAGHLLMTEDGDTWTQVFCTV